MFRPSILFDPGGVWILIDIGDGILPSYIWNISYPIRPNRASRFGMTGPPKTYHPNTGNTSGGIRLDVQGPINRRIESWITQYYMGCQQGFIERG